MIEDEADSALLDLEGVASGCAHGSNLLNDGVSSKPGAVQNATYAYDAKGRTTGVSGDRAYTMGSYDEHDLPLSMAVPQGGGDELRLRYRYDGGGHRVFSETTTRTQTQWGPADAVTGRTYTLCIGSQVLGRVEEDAATGERRVIWSILSDGKAIGEYDTGRRAAGFS